jgi:hypothetical protein
MAEESQTVQCECGYCGPVSNFCPECGKKFRNVPLSGLVDREFSTEEKQKLTEHGWRNQDGTLLMLLRDGRLISQYITGVNAVGFTGFGTMQQKPEEFRLDTGYSYYQIGMMPGGMMMGLFGIKVTSAGFTVYLRDADYHKAEQAGAPQYRILRLWYGSGTLHVDLYSFKDQRSFTVDLVLDDAVRIPFAEEQPKVGLTCPKCGSEFQTGMYCEQCGAELNWEPLFSGSTYSSCNPPVSTGFSVYAFSDEKLIYQYYTNEITERRYISADVIDEAYRIIREYHIDEWEQYQNTYDGIMGGDVSVRYRDGDRLVGTSLSHMGSMVQSAYWALRELFGKNIL